MNQLAAKIANLINKPFDHEIRERVKDSYKFALARELHRRIEKYGLKDQYIHSFEAPLTQVDGARSCSSQVGCIILRTVNKIPGVIDYISDSPFVSVESLTGYAYPYRKLAEIRGAKYTKFVGKSLGYFLENGYIYILNATRMDQIKVSAVFADIEEVLQYCDSSCYSDDMQYPIPADLLTDITTEILRNEFGVINQKSIELTLNDIGKTDN